MMTEEQEYQELNSWLEVLKPQVTDLRVDQHIFWEVQEIIRRNPKIHAPGDFNEWMGRMYAFGMSVAIRRQVDRDTRSISFLRFLEKVKANPTVVSRERFTAFYKERGMSEYWAGLDFDNHVGAGLSHLEANVVEKEIETLMMRTDTLHQYVNKRIAHHDQNEFTNFPKFQDVDDAIKCLEDLLKRYWLLFRGGDLTQLLPYWQYDWKAVFRVPWIAGPRSEGHEATV